MTYLLQHALGTVDIALAGDRIIVKTQGTGVIDKLKTIDIPLADLKQFCVVPTIAAQSAIAPGMHDTSYDSEFIFSYREGTKVRKKRVFVNSAHPAFRAIVAQLQQSRADASLMHLPPADAQKQIGVLSAKTAVILVIAVVVTVPLVVIAIAIATGH